MPKPLFSWIPVSRLPDPSGCLRSSSRTPRLPPGAGRGSRRDCRYSWFSPQSSASLLQCGPSPRLRDAGLSENVGQGVKVLFAGLKVSALPTFPPKDDAFPLKGCCSLFLPAFFSNVNSSVIIFQELRWRPHRLIYRVTKN